MTKKKFIKHCKKRCPHYQKIARSGPVDYSNYCPLVGNSTQEQLDYRIGEGKPPMEYLWFKGQFNFDFVPPEQCPFVLEMLYSDKE